MSIAWLWHYTHAADPDALRRFNEHRAAAFHERSRNASRVVARLDRRLRGTISRWRERRRERALRRELEQLPKSVLKDIGWPPRDLSAHAGSAGPAHRARRGSSRDGTPRGATPAPGDAYRVPSPVPPSIPSPLVSPSARRSTCRDGARPDLRRRDAAERAISGCAAPDRRRARSAPRRASRPCR